VFGPGRTRLLTTSKWNDTATVAELKRSYDRARAMLAGSAQVEDSLLLRKPLEPFVGGQGHKGVDEFGRNVYRFRGDPNYMKLVAWARSAASDPADVAPGAAGMGAAGMGAAP
jgi:hypothetical protein